MEDLSKPRVDVSDLGALEKEESLVNTKDDDEYEKHQNAPKEVVGNIVIGDIIGKGGFATVCKGLNLTTGEVVAVKKFERSKISPQQVGSVMYEVELLQRLTHENIVHILGKAESDKHLYLFMEYMENGSMRGMLQSFGAFPEQLVAQFMEQVLQGLIYLHDAGVVHRDIKAANILLNRNNVKLADFGVAAELNENDRRYSVVGTPYWMAPEVIEITGHSLASDIWSVGCVVIEMITGKPPYFHLNPMSAMFRIVQDPFPPIPKGISKDLETFLKCCFQKDPEHRLTARELLVHPWITHRTTPTPVATSHEAIRNSLISAGHPVAQTQAQAQAAAYQKTPQTAQTHAIAHAIAHAHITRTDRSDSSERTVVHRGRSFDYTSSPASTPVSSSPLTIVGEDDTSSLASLSRSSSFADALDRSAADCSECAQLRRALNEEKTKRQEILLTAINYIASSDAAREGASPIEAQLEFRNGLRAMLEEEFKLAFPDDNMPRFMQRRLTICNDQLPHIPAPSTPPTDDKKDRKRKEKEEKEREEKEKRERKEREKREKEERDKRKKDSSSSFLSRDKKDPAKKKDTSTPSKKDKEKEKEKEKEREREREKEIEREKEKEKEKEKASWFAARRSTRPNASSSSLSIVVPPPLAVDGES